MLLGGNETTKKIDSFAINELKMPSIVLMENAAISFVKHIDENGVEFWYARELMTILEYTLCSEGRFKHLSFFVKILKYFIKRC